MRTILLSKSRSLELLFEPCPERRPPQDLDELTSDPPDDAVIYLDAAALPKRGLADALDRLSSSRHLRWALIDRARTFHDPAAIFHAGGCDYVGPEAQEGAIDAQRLERVAAYAARLDPEASRHHAHRAHGSSFPGWDALEEGKSYELLTLYAALADADGLRTRLGENRFARLKANAQTLAANLAQDAGGLLWIVDDRSFLLLFQPETVTQVITSCLKVLANMQLISFEQFRLEQETVSLSFSLRRAPVPWQKPGKTGTVISDALNYIFHLGRRFTPPGSIDLVDGLGAELPPRLAARLESAGDFEGRPVERFAGFRPADPSAGKSRR